jgi:16S rRNA processing protein RimM
MADRKSTGSPLGEPDYLAVGFLRRPHGLDGSMLMDLHTDFPERLRAGRRLFLGDEHKPVTLSSVRQHSESVIVKLKGIDTPEAAGRYRNTWLFVKTKDMPALPEGQHYQYQLLGLKVVDEEGQVLGILTEILETGANDVYVVTNEGGQELLLPAIPSVILELRPEDGLIRVHVLEGL